MKNKSVRIKITKNNKIIKPWAILYEFPHESIVKGIQREFRKGRVVETLEEFKDLKLCNYKDKWWIYYEADRMTGSFDSRDKAIGWFERAGR